MSSTGRLFRALRGSFIWFPGLVLAATIAAGILAPRWVALVYAGVFVVTAFGVVVRRDPIGFASIAVPTVLFGLLAGVAGFGLLRAVLSGIALVLPAVFLLGENRTWAWWSRHILRRPSPSPERTFDLALMAAVRAFCRPLLDFRPGQASEDAVRDARAAREQLTQLAPPDPSWKDLQSDYATWMSDMLALWARVPVDGDSWPSIKDRGEGLATRARRLRGQEPEWRGVYPTLPKGTGQAADQDASGSSAR